MCIRDRLNSGKGPAVRALRAQADKTIYPQEMLKTLKSTDNLTLLEGLVKDIIVQDGKVQGVILEDDTKITSSAVILTTGTYMNADILVGSERRREGPHGEKPSNYLSDNLAKHGFEIKRLKTGTPQRVAKNSIDFSKTKREDGDSIYHTFSFDMDPVYDVNNQEPCYLTYTTNLTHQIIHENLNKSSMYLSLIHI